MPCAVWSAVHNQLEVEPDKDDSAGRLVLQSNDEVDFYCHTFIMCQVSPVLQRFIKGG